VTPFATETAETVYRRTYARTLPDGRQETWPETVRRVVDGNLALVPRRYVEPGEREALVELIEAFRVLPAGRHLKSSGVNDFALNNCWAAGWDAAKPEEHFTFTLLRLAEGGGVGANYSDRYLRDFPEVQVPVEVHIVCDPDHADYLELVEAGVISTEYSHTWAGAYPVEDSREGWAAALGDLIRTAHDTTTKHTQRVYDVSRVRPKGSVLRSFGGTASGPAPFARMLHRIGKILWAARGDRLDGIDAMDIDHEIAQCIIAGGVRRSARMSTMHWADPMINSFLTLKAGGGHWTTNISVEVDDAFIRLLGKMDSPSWPVLYRVAKGMLHNGEPGLWNASLSAAGEVDGIYTTNPCGEATLTAWEPCNLGSVNLGSFVNSAGQVDRTGLMKAHRLLTRFLIRATYAPAADAKSAGAIARYRRIGVGHLGLADYLIKRGIRYSEATEKPTVREELRQLATVVDQAATDYANELRIPVPVKKRVIAPTGTTSKLAGASGEGIHPLFATHFIRRVRFSDLEPSEVAQVQAYREAGYHVEPCAYATNTTVVAIPTKDPLADIADSSAVEHAGQLAIEDMLAMQVMYQEVWADQAVSYTVNVDPTRYGPEELAGLLKRYLPALKGTTVFPEMSHQQSPYERISRQEYDRLTADLDATNTDTSYDETCTSGACPI
jgi:ribonucleoside-triphosphate reductase